MLTVLALATAPAFASSKDDKKEKKDKKEERNKKDDKKDEKKKEVTYVATISVTEGEAKEDDTAEVSACLKEAKNFKCKEVKLDGKQLVATLTVEKGRLSKSDVTACLKEKKKYKVDKLDDVKPEKEKKEDKKDKEEKKDEKKDEEKKDAK